MRYGLLLLRVQLNFFHRYTSFFGIEKGQPNEFDYPSVDCGCFLNGLGLVQAGGAVHRLKVENPT
jgi:hypothetical protein